MLGQGLLALGPFVPAGSRPAGGCRSPDIRHSIPAFIHVNVGVFFVGKQ